MPVSPALAEHLAADLVEAYAEAERRLLAVLAKRLASGIDSPQWAQTKLAQVQALKRETQALLRDLKAQAETGVGTAITAAYEAGGLSAVQDIAKLKPGAKIIEPLGTLRAIEALTAETLGNVTATHPAILRAVANAYDRILRDTIATEAKQALLGSQTRRQAAQSALDRFARAGIKGFTDKAGRGWTMESYTEMAMRTGCGRATVQGHEARLTANGFDLVIVSDAPRECERCRPWEGKVLSITGKTPGYPTVAEARDAGLFHCTCRHTESAYQEGITKMLHATADPEGYAATTKLRYLERQTRAAKRVQAAAMDDAAKAAAGARVRAYQAKIREHVASTTAKRQPHRERLGAL